MYYDVRKGGDNLNKRIKQVREYFGLTQEAFGERIGAARNTIANYENGNRTPGKSIILSICREFNANEDWLRNGGSDDDMFKPEFENDELATYCADISEGKDPFIADMLLKYKKLSPRHKQAIWEIYEELQKKEEDT